LSKWFVDRGFAVLLPQRRGHGATGGGHAETFRQPHGVDFIAAGQNGADDISAAVSYMRKQKFIDGANISLVGVSSGGWASLALASRNPPFIRAAINFAGGRGGRVRGIANQNVAPEKLVEASAFFGQLARIPSLWIYARNDKHFGPDLAQRLYQAWEKGGAPTECKHPL
jgi:dienelactone hydrolase